MEPTKKIVWLASYPKSGNTWFRAFLTALLGTGEADLDINSLYPTTIASSRQLFDEMAGTASADLTAEEIDRLRPRIYRLNAEESDDMLYHKIHDAYILLPDGQPIIPHEVTRSVLYFIRNPLDVVVSFANHLSTSIDKTIAIMNNPDYAFCSRTDRLHNQLRQRLFTWSGHVKSWVDHSNLPLRVVRYEDMQADPLEAFGKAAAFIGLERDKEQVEAALEKCSFERMQQQEREKGFHEKSAASQSFFRKGVVGDWKQSLTPRQADRIVNAHREVMERFGYLVNN
jgi:hypothetical protein